MAWKMYQSGDVGIPTLSGTAGDLTTLLDAVLVNGGTTQAITSITRSGSTATVTSTGAHGITVGSTAILTIAGAGQSEYNLTAVTVTATTSTQFTYTVAGTPATPATGTITWRHSAAGWTIPYTGTNKRVYYNGAGALSRRYFRIDDNATGTGGAKEALIKGGVTASDVDTLTSPFPTAIQSSLTANSAVIRKSAAASATTRSFKIFADDRTCLMFIISGDTASHYYAYCFGERYSFIPSDTTCCVLMAKGAENTTDVYSIGNGPIQVQAFSGIGAEAGCWFCGDTSGFNISTPIYHLAPPNVNLSGGQGTGAGPIAYPNLGDGGLYLSQGMLLAAYSGGGGSYTAMGRVRGVWFQGHAASSFTDGDTFTGAGELAGKSFIILKYVKGVSDNTGVIAIETTQPAYSS